MKEIFRVLFSLWHFGGLVCPPYCTLFLLAVLCIVVRLTLADSNTVLLAYYESLRFCMTQPVLTGVENVLTGVLSRWPRMGG
jgi:hypothetical protein